MWCEISEMLAKLLIEGLKIHLNLFYISYLMTNTVIVYLNPKLISSLIYEII